jgi:hypothetical protein
VARAASGGCRARGCGFRSQINLQRNSPEWRPVGFRVRSPDQIFSFDLPESLDQRGFRETVSRKIWFSKNLDIKILGTKGLGLGTLGAPDRHCLVHDRAIWIGRQGWMSQGGCGNLMRLVRVNTKKFRTAGAADRLSQPRLPL